MATLTTIRNYDDLSLLTEAQLNAVFDSIEDFINVVGVSDANIQDRGITASTKFAAASVTNATIQDNAVTSVKFIADSVTASKLAADTAGNGLLQLPSGALSVSVDDVTLEHSSNSLRVVDGSITNTKRDTNVIVYGREVDGFTTPTGFNFSSLVDITSYAYGDVGGPTSPSTTITFTATGDRPWIFWLQSTRKPADLSGTNYGSYIHVKSSTSPVVRIGLFEGTTRINETTISSGITGADTAALMVPPQVFKVITIPTAGEHTYTLKVTRNLTYSVLSGFALLGMEL